MRTAAEKAQPGHSQADAATTETDPYPRARWRLAQSDLSRVVLWASHILIRHDQSDRESAFALGWTIEPPPPHRSQAEAFRLATVVAARAAASPEKFADLAREYSEDVVTREWKGSVGGITAAQARFDSPLLDALAALKAGEVSRVVETTHGFHVLVRRAPPPFVTVAARRIVIDYEGAGLLGANRSTATRSREEALAIARSVAATLREDPAQFDALSTQWSPKELAAKHGDFGVWTNREVGSFEREREMLAGMRVGQISEPIDGQEGLQVFVRDPVPPDYQEYVVRVLKIPPSSPPAADAAPAATVAPDEKAMVEANSIARTLASEPRQWEVFGQKYCCKKAERWSKGRTSAALFNAVKDLAIGGISPVPVSDPPFLTIVKRVDPAEGEFPSVLFELPAPNKLDVPRYAVGVSGSIVQTFIRRLADDAATELALTGESAERVKKLHARLADSFQAGGSRESREDAVAAFREDMQGVLSAEQFKRYEEITQRAVGAKVMEQW